MLRELQDLYGPLTVYCLAHGIEGGILMQKLLPPFLHLRIETAPFAYPPVLNLAPRELLGEVTEHYLFTALLEIMYTSLLIENRQRATHLQGAVKRIDEESEILTRQGNVLRQEEIIEEIEVILLGAAETGQAQD